MVKTYIRRPIRVEALHLDKGNYSEAVLFIEKAGHKIDVNVRAFIGIIADDSTIIPANYGDYLVLDKNNNLFVFDPVAFKINFAEKIQ